MKLKDIIQRKRSEFGDMGAAASGNKSRRKKMTDIPCDMWVKCSKCKKVVYGRDVQENSKVCPSCGYLFRLSPMERIELVADSGTFQEFDFDIKYENPLEFPGYIEKLHASAKASGSAEAVVCGRCKIDGIETVICIMNTFYMMGSMGHAVGEMITKSVEEATALKLPLVIFTASGGARMQEGMVSLMQMAKVSAALLNYSKSGGLYITVITDPTTGGVTASFAMLGDIILAEKGALIGFAGKRVIEQTVTKKLPTDFQTAEFALSNGFVDKIVDRSECKKILSKILMIHGF